MHLLIVKIIILIDRQYKVIDAKTNIERYAVREEENVYDIMISMRTNN